MFIVVGVPAHTPPHLASKKQSAKAKKAYKSNGLFKWTAAVMKAREEMGVTGFMVRFVSMVGEPYQLPSVSFVSVPPVHRP